MRILQNQNYDKIYYFNISSLFRIRFVSLREAEKVEMEFRINKAKQERTN